MRKSLHFALLALAVVSVACVAAAQKKVVDGTLQCRDSMRSDRLQNHCEIQEQTLNAGGPINVDGKQNGGVAVKGWDQNKVLVRSRIQTSAPTQAEADLLAKQIIVDTNGLRIHARGPEQRDDYQWSVSYEVFVPTRSDLSLSAHNGGISINNVHGKIDFETTNGGVSLQRVGGAVRGTTTNGGAHVVLSGSRWDGEELSVRTTNGGVDLTVPENYSAHLETGTVNGPVNFDFPVNVALTARGRMPRNVNVDLGSGGPTVRVMTTNGGVQVRKSSVN